MPIRKIIAASLVATLISGCAVFEPPPQGPDPTEQKIAELERRLAALERILASGALIELTEQVDDLQRQSAEIRGRTDTLEHDADGTSVRQRELYVDLDDRVRTLEQNMRARPTSVPQTAPVNALPVPGGTDRQNYEAAFELLKQQQYQAAGAAFGQFLVSFPNSQLADNAQYWLAEASYVTDQFEDALVQFQVVLNSYPRSRKIPDALLKIGYSNYELARWDGARSALQRVSTDFPDSTAARLANQRLTRMNDEGH
ncbi:MAG: tol-pal system protein YbgF [Woeseiaceae bacterium]